MLYFVLCLFTTYLLQSTARGPAASCTRLSAFLFCVLQKDAAGRPKNGNARDVITIAEASKGTKENDACSGRGHCDESTGWCTCFVTAADGRAGSGTASTAAVKVRFLAERAGWWLA